MRNYKKIDDLYIEKISPDQIKNENKYDLDNKIYTVGRIFKFKIEYKNLTNDSIEEKFLELEIQGGTKPFSDIDSTYAETVIRIKYLNNENKVLGSERTGIIENEVNTWIHPPRSNIFHILQLNAFPFFIKSESSKKRWSWELECSHDIYKNILIHHKYFQKKVSGNFNGEDKYIIKSYSKSKAGICKTTNVFSSLYGFKEMTYINYDKSFFSFKLISIKEKDGAYFFKK